MKIMPDRRPRSAGSLETGLVIRISLAFIAIRILMALAYSALSVSQGRIDMHESMTRLSVELADSIRQTDGQLVFHPSDTLAERLARLPAFGYRISTDHDGKVVSGGVMAAERSDGLLLREGEGDIRFIALDGSQRYASRNLVQTPAGLLDIRLVRGPATFEDILRWNAAKFIGSFLPLIGVVTLLTILATVAIVRFSLRPLQEFTRSVSVGRRIERFDPDAIRSLPKEMAPLFLVVAEAFERLDRVVRRQQKYLANIAHEFRTHLAILQARIDTLPDADSRQQLGTNLAGLTRVIDQSLVFARIKAGQFGFEPVDLVKLARDIVIEKTPYALQFRRLIEFESDAGIALVNANQNLLEAAFRNVLENAVQHTRSGTAVEVSVSADCTIEIRDHGPGIPENKRNEMFEPFWPERAQGKGGAGLGLALVRETVLLHGGTVRFSNHPEGGAIFHITLPVMQEFDAHTMYGGVERRGAPADPVTETLAQPIPLKAIESRRGGRLGSLDTGYLASIIENSDDAIISKRLNGTITSWNRAAERIFGYGEDEMIGQRAERLFASDHARDEEFILERLQDGERIEHFETVHVRKDGEKISVSLTVSPIRDQTGKIIGISRIARDITGAKRMEKALREKLALLSAITDNATEGMMLSDRQGRATFVNPSAERLTGWSAADLVGRQLHATLHHRHRDGSGYPAEECPLAKIYKTGEPAVDFEDILIRRDDSVVDVSYSNAPIVVDGEITGGVLIVHDISERKRVEQTLREALKLEAMANLTGGLAHDFNNLLSIIVGNLELLISERESDGDILELAGDALNAAVRGGELTRSLLAFARRQTLQSRVLDANEVVAQTVKLLSRTLGENIEVTCRLASDAWNISADASQLEAALTNLAANARDAMPKGGSLIIGTANRHLPRGYVGLGTDVVEGDYLTIEVIDNGTGIPADIRDKIFEPFFTTKGPEHGTGLGLSMVFGFLKQSNGMIGVESEEGAGSTFRLYFPRARQAIQVEQTIAPAYSAGQGERVLVVEDNPILRRTVCRQLRELGYEPLEAETVAEAIGILEKRSVPVVLTDVVMPGGRSGFDLVEEVNYRWPEIRLIITSGFPDAELGHKGLDPSKISILNKPYRKEELGRIMGGLAENNV